MIVVAEGPTRKNVFKEVARIRAQDAGVLLKERRFLGAIYLLGYSIECYLKFAVCEQYGWTHLPAKVRLAGHPRDLALYTHDWPDLVDVCGLTAAVRRNPSTYAIYTNLSDVWGPHLRYRTSAFRAGEAANLYNNLVELYSFLKEQIP